MRRLRSSAEMARLVVILAAAVLVMGTIIAVPIVRRYKMRTDASVCALAIDSAQRKIEDTALLSGGELSAEEAKLAVTQGLKDKERSRSIWRTRRASFTFPAPIQSTAPTGATARDGRETAMTISIYEDRFLLIYCCVVALLLGAALAFGGGMLALSLAMDRILQKETLGGGDVKLFAVIGLYLGAAGSLFACVLGLLLAAALRRGPGQPFPFGPAVAAPASLLEHAREMLGKAGLKLAKAAPAEYAYVALLRGAERGSEKPREYCILDLGYRAVRMFMFRGDQHMVTRSLETGLRNVDEAVAEAMGVDIHLAHTYLENDYENGQEKKFCVSAYDRIAVELMRALNFYRFSNPDSTLSDVWLCGGGAGVKALRSAVSETLDLNVHSAEELLTGDERVQQPYHFLQAVGITMD